MTSRILPILLLTLVALSPGVTASYAVTPVRKAVRQLCIRASSGDAKALYDLARLHDTGFDSIPVDSARSTMLYTLSAEKGYAKAQNYLGFRYFRGEHVRQNADTAVMWLSKAAENGDAGAANNLGFLYHEGGVLPKDFAKAFRWLTVADSAGVPEAASLLGDMLRIGEGCIPDTALAAKRYEKAISAGLHDTQWKLISMMKGKWERLEPDSVVKSGKRYLHNNAPDVAAVLFANAASHNNPDALALLGLAYSRGLGVDYDHELSKKYLYEAALLGQPSACFIIAELLDIFPDAFNGLTQQPPEPARHWYDKAAEAGIRDAETAISRLVE